MGTGVIIDERGYVITNHHVVASGQQITVRLTDKSSVRAVVYEATGTVPAAILAAGATRVSAFARRSHAGGELLDADPTASQEWLQAALDAVRMALAPR